MNESREAYAANNEIREANAHACTQHPKGVI